MTILKIIEALQSYSEDILAYKLDGQFANAVTEAVSLLIGQGEQIADLQNELRDDRWIPVSERLPEKEGTYIVHTTSGAVTVAKFYCEKVFPPTKRNPHEYHRKAGWSRYRNVVHWMPLPEPPKEVQHDE